MPPEQNQPQNEPVQPSLNQNNPQPVQPPVQPVQPTQQFSNSSAGASMQDMKNLKRTAITALILGVIMTLLGITLGVAFHPVLYVNALLGVAYVAIGVKLKKTSATNAISETVRLLRLLAILLIINVLIPLLSGDGIGVGVLPALLLVFVLQASQDLHKKGLTTSANPIRAKVTN